MFKNTVAAYHIISKEIRIFSRIATILYSLFMVSYLLYSAVANDMTIKFVLAGIFGASLLVSLLPANKELKAAKSIFRHLSTFAKLVLNAVSLAAILYAVQTTPDTVDKMQTIILPLLILAWVLQLLLELCSLYIEKRGSLLVDGLAMDLEPLTKTTVAINHVFGGDAQGLQINEHNRSIIEAEKNKTANAKKQMKKAKKQAKSKRFFSKLSPEKH